MVIINKFSSNKERGVLFTRPFWERNYGIRISLRRTVFCGNRPRRPFSAFSGTGCFLGSDSHFQIRGRIRILRRLDVIAGDFAVINGSSQTTAIFPCSKNNRDILIVKYIVTGRKTSSSTRDFSLSIAKFNRQW